MERNRNMNLQNVVVRKTKPVHYESVDKFFEEHNLDRFAGEEGHHACYSAVVKALNYDACKKILLEQLEHDGIDLETLKQRYEADKALNNIYKFRYQGTGGWTWDDIGADMLYNYDATVSFRLMSPCNKTCIAKACARMVVEEG